MEELFPLQLTLPFKTKIISYRFVTLLNHRVFYQCSTNYGTMTLIHEEVFNNLQLSKNDKNNTTDQQCNSPGQKLSKRKKLLSSFPFSTFVPVIYQQLIIPSHKDRAVCLTLTEPIEVLTMKDIHQKVIVQKEKFLMLGVQAVSRTQQWSMTFLNQQKLNQIVLFKSILGEHLFIDFTQLQITCGTQKQKKKQYQISLIQNFLKRIDSPQKNNQQASGRIKRIILIKDRLYKISKQKLLSKEFLTWQSLCICLNFMMEEQVQIKVTEKNSNKQLIERIKSTVLKSISSGEPNLAIQIFESKKDKESLGQYYFYDGFCTDLLEIVQYEELLKGFFIDNSTYCLKKDTYLWIERIQNAPQKACQSKKLKRSDTILISEGVQKCECINFFITYCKFVEPILKKIHFDKQQNTLIFQFLGKWKVERQLKLVFEPTYLIKDEQLSMIIQKSKIEDLVLQLSGMPITDSFLMFLANSSKMSKIKNLDISYCSRVTENGVNSLLISPFCKSLHVLNVSGTHVGQSSIESLLKKGELKDLIMNNCIVQDCQESSNFMIQNSKLLKLQAIGMNVTGNFGSSLKVLKIGTFVPLQFLKELKDMPLTELTIRLIEEKKNIIGGLMGTIGTFYSSKESNPIKIFAQGTTASKNIKFLDLSDSMTKLKNLKYLFVMPQLETLRLENLSLVQEIDFSVCPKIIDLSFKNSDISIRDLTQLIKTTKFLLKLNISNTLIQKSEIVDFLCVSKKYVNTLVISQNQYSMNLIDPNGRSSEFVETFEINCKIEFFRLKNQKILSNMLFKTFRSNKNLKFRTDSQSEAIVFLSKFINWHNIDSVRNIFINDKPYKLVYQNMKQRQEREKKINCVQFLRIHLKNKKPILISLNRSQNQTQKQEYQDDRTQINNELTSFLYLYRKTILEYPEGAIQISLRGNQVINCLDAISLIKLYSGYQNIKSIDLRKCTLTSNNILPQIIEIPLLESYNHNQYQVFIDQSNFSYLSQRYLMFFMRISSIKKLKLECKQVIEAELLFSIFFHVLDYHYQSIEELQLNLLEIKMSKENSGNFWMKLCQLKKVKSLKIKIVNCPTAFLKKIFQKCQINHNNNLEILEIEGIDHISLLSLQNGYSLKKLSMNFQSQTISEASLLKLLKPYGPSLTSLYLNLSKCDQITFPNKLFAILGEFRSLQTLNISFEYCPLKELSTIDFLENMCSLKRLRQLQIDLSFTSITYNSIANVISQFPSKLSKCYTVIYLVGNQSRQLQIDKEALQSQGLQIIL